jgi:hypothetical protein
VCLVGCQPAEVDHSQQPSATGPAATEKKAEALEQNAAAAGNKAPPSPSEMINKPEAQAVDPAGGEPLDDSDQAKEDESYATAKEIARKALNLRLTDRTGGALYFHQRNATPGWAAEYTKTVEIGEFVFYKPRGGEAR